MGTERLKQYWQSGPGAAKIVWNTPGDYTRCVTLLGKYVPDRMVRGFCANVHKGATGRWPGENNE
jgi:hypothetical protein